MPSPNASDRAYTYLRTQISQGEYGPGSHLKEEDVAAVLGVSRTPIREAIRRLDSEGWVELIPNRGAFVTGWPESDLEEIFRLRAVVEGYGAQLAASRITDEALAELESLSAAMEATRTTKTRDDVWGLNDRFHRAVMQASGNRRLVAMQEDLTRIPLVRPVFRRYTDEFLRSSLMQHDDLVAALRSRNPAWARHAMTAHILGGAKVFRLPGVPPTVERTD